MLRGSWCIQIHDSYPRHVLKYLPCSEPPRHGGAQKKILEARQLRHHPSLAWWSICLDGRSHHQTGQTCCFQKLTIIISTQTQESQARQITCHSEVARTVPWAHFSECPGACLSSWCGCRVRMLEAGRGGLDLFNHRLGPCYELSSHRCCRNVMTIIFSILQVRPPVAERQTGMYPRSHSYERHSQGLVPGSLPLKSWHRGDTRTGRSFPASLKGSPGRRDPQHAPASFDHQRLGIPFAKGSPDPHACL